MKLPTDGDSGGAPLLPSLDEPRREPGAAALLEAFFEEPAKRSVGAALLQEAVPREGAEVLPHPHEAGSGVVSVKPVNKVAPRNAHRLWGAPHRVGQTALIGSVPRRQQGPLALASLLEVRGAAIAAAQPAIAAPAVAAPLLPAVLLGTSADMAEPGMAFRNPEVWGPPTWFFLHSLTMSLPEVVPEAKQKQIRALMYDLQVTLPCPSCGEHLAEHMKEHPICPHLARRDTMVQWMIDIHNMVNKECGKPEMLKEEVMAQYEAAFAQGSQRKSLEVLSPLYSHSHSRSPALGLVTLTCVYLLGLGPW